jgi:hypothetical protein
MTTTHLDISTGLKNRLSTLEIIYSKVLLERVKVKNTNMFHDPLLGTWVTPR